jgi:hypothetical protein
MPGRRPRYGRHGAQVRDDRAQVLVGETGKRHQRNERPAITRDTVAEPSNQRFVAQRPDSAGRVARDVGRHCRAERSEIELFAAAEIVAVACAAMRRPVDEVASPLYEGGIQGSVDAIARRRQDHGAASSDGGRADGDKIFRRIAHRGMVLAEAAAAPRFFGEAHDLAVSRRAPFTARNRRSPTSAGARSYRDPHLSE